MRILVMSNWQAVCFNPKKRTYAIRIFDSESPKEERTPLRDSPQYIGVREYFFDDNSEDSIAGAVSIDSEIAKKIIEDFRACKDEAKCLLVHCVYGENRSPAVAMALNEIFELGHNPKTMMEKYPHANMYVYNKLKKTAENLK